MQNTLELITGFSAYFKVSSDFSLFVFTIQMHSSTSERNITFNVINTGSASVRLVQTLAQQTTCMQYCYCVYL